jgi:ADP-ribose pyrophosphatase YjhB (NUDIX family)
MTLDYQPPSKWIEWSRELRTIALTGLASTRGPFDRERYEQLLELTTEISTNHSNVEHPTISLTFDATIGSETPKVDVRGVVFQGRRLLLVRERHDGLWSLPGGWADVNDSPSEAVEKEILEESGYIAKATRLLAILDQAKHPHRSPYPFRTYKFFIMCSLGGGTPQTGLEVSEVGFFGQNKIPPLSTFRVTREQIDFCFDVHDQSGAPCRFD